MVIYGRLLSLVASCLVSLFTILGLYGGDTLPAKSLFTAGLTFMLPVLCIINVVLVVFWAFRRKIYILIPVITLLLSWSYIGTILQFRSGDPETEGTFTVATYNVRLFNQDNTGLQAQDIMTMLLEEKADVVCLQEYNDQIDNEHGRVTQNMRKAYPYVAHGNSDMIILSRFPIRETKNVPFEYSNNSFHWADVQVQPGKIVRVFNVHMETTGINRTLRAVSKAREAAAEASDSAAGEAYVHNSRIYEALMGNYVFSLSVRSGQSILVANEKLASPHPIVLCGDFNDVPYSFTYNTLLGDLKDGFKEGGKGFMFTYRGAKGIFRIDYIFHDESMQSAEYKLLDKNYSDHNPVISRLKFK